MNYMQPKLTTDSELLTPARSSRAGFTLIELLLYVAITAVVVGMFSTVLVTFTSVQNRQSSSSKATSEMGFLMTTLERLVHESANMTVVDENTLLLASSTPSITKTITFDAVNHAIMQTDDDGVNPAVVSQLSSSNIQIDLLSFTDRSAGASKTVNIVLTATVFPNNVKQKLTRTLQSTAALYVQEP